MARRIPGGRKEDGKEGIVVGRSIDFLGYVCSRNNVRLRKCIKHNFAYKVNRTKNEIKLQQVKASYWGWCKWGRCRHLWNVITNNDMSFAQKGIRSSGTTKDGKKYYQVKTVPISDILNIPIKVIDFESGITTSKGSDRYAVLYELPTKEVQKFLTSAFEIKNVLDQAREAERNGQQIFPVEGVIVRKRSFGDGKSSYYFDE